MIVLGIKVLWTNRIGENATSDVQCVAKASEKPLHRSSSAEMHIYVVQHASPSNLQAMNTLLFPVLSASNSHVRQQQYTVNGYQSFFLGLK